MRRTSDSNVFLQGVPTASSVLISRRVATSFTNWKDSEMSVGIPERPRCLRRGHLLLKSIDSFASSRNPEPREGTLWRKRVRVERTEDGQNPPPAGFEDRKGHRTPCASVLI